MNKPIRSMSFRAEEKELLLEKLRQSAQSSSHNRRSVSRQAYQMPSVEIRITQVRGPTVPCRVITHDLSDGGISFVYWGFLYNETSVEVLLQRADGSLDVIQGKTVWCQHLSGIYHVVGVAFMGKISLQDYIDPGEVEVAGDTPAAEALPLGSVLVIDDQEIDRTLLCYQLGGCRIKTYAVGTSFDAMDILLRNKINVILCDLNLAETTGEAAINQFRKAGFKGTIIAVTAEESPERLASAQAAGAAEIIQKPCDPQTLCALLTKYLVVRETQNGPIFSTLPERPDTQEMILRFIQTARTLAGEIQLALESHNLQQLRLQCQTLKGTGRGYGFAQVSDLADEALRFLAAPGSLPQASESLQRLRGICCRLATARPH